MTTVKKGANAIGGKTARACERCLRKRARWYCAADDAFLCQGCDTNVHSANRLASRHERTSLKTSFRKTNDISGDQNYPPAPAWHHGFTRKARTPRNSMPSSSQPRKDDENIANTNLFSLVPEIGNDEGSLDEEELELLCRVPVLDTFARVPVLDTFACTDLFDVPNETVAIDGKDEIDLLFTEKEREACDLVLQGFLPSEMDMERGDFAADVESLLGGADEETHQMADNKLELTDSNKEDRIDVCFDSYKVKVEDEQVEALMASQLDPALDMAKGTANWNLFTCELQSLLTGEDETGEKFVTKVENTIKIESKEEVKRKNILRLNYEEVISAWSSHNNSPWTTGTRPEFNPDDCFSDFVGTCSEGVRHNHYGGMRMRTGGGCADGEREARVSRYREKRRTRLFSKKIRYEVRKLNAEKRPRMNGRFVKRTSSSSFAGHPTAAASTFTCSLINKWH